MGKPIAYVCQGKKCARACAHDALLRALCKVADVRLVRCQKICHGSVVATPLGGELEWFERVDTPRLAVAIKRATIAGKRKALVQPLKKRRLKGLSGIKPR